MLIGWDTPRGGMPAYITGTMTKKAEVEPGTWNYVSFDGVRGLISVGIHGIDIVGSGGGNSGSGSPNFILTGSDGFLTIGSFNTLSGGDGGGGDFCLVKVYFIPYDYKSPNEITTPDFETDNDFVVLTTKNILGLLPIMVRMTGTAGRIYVAAKNLSPSSTIWLTATVEI